MPTLAERLASAASVEVESAGMTWRVRKVNSADIVKAGVARMRMITPDIGDEIDEVRRKKKGRKVTEEDAQRVLLKQLEKIDPNQISQVGEYHQAVVCAGLTHAFDEAADDWSEIRAVMTQAEAKPADNILCVTDLPAGVVADLFEAIEQLETDKGAAVKRLNSFLEGPKPADANP